MAGIIKAAKDVLEGAIKVRVPALTIVRSAADEIRAIMAQQFPLASLITNRGKFDDRTAGTAQYANTDTNTLVQRYIRGSRTEFKEAANVFLNAPVGASAPIGGKE
jgi:hypothetical protein